MLSTTLIAYDELSLGTIDEGNSYLLDIANGANPLTNYSRTTSTRSASCLVNSKRSARLLHQSPAHRSASDGRDDYLHLARPDRCLRRARRWNDHQLPHARRERNPFFQWEIQGDEMRCCA
jgi:hypothetical protein